MLLHVGQKLLAKPGGAIRHYLDVSLIKSQRAGMTTYSSFWGTRGPLTDIYLRSVAPNLDRLAGVIEGGGGDVAIRRDEAEAEG